MLTFVLVSYGEMFYVYSNDTSNYSKGREGREIKDGGIPNRLFKNVCSSGAMILEMLMIIML